MPCEWKWIKIQLLNIEYPASEETLFFASSDHLDRVLRVRFPDQISAVCINRMLGNIKLFCNLLADEAIGKEHNDFALASRDTNGFRVLLGAII